jgi:hypothetical protein
MAGVQQGPTRLKYLKLEKAAYPGLSVFGVLPSMEMQNALTWQ